MNQPTLFDSRPTDVESLDAQSAEELARRCVSRLMSLGYPAQFFMQPTDVREEVPASIAFRSLWGGK